VRRSKPQEWMFLASVSVTSVNAQNRISFSGFLYKNGAVQTVDRYLKNSRSSYTEQYELNLSHISAYRYFSSFKFTLKPNTEPFRGDLVSFVQGICTNCLVVCHLFLVVLNTVSRKVLCYSKYTLLCYQRSLCNNP